MKYDYTVDANSPSRIATFTQQGSVVNDSYSFFDGWGRQVESQVRQADGDADNGRVVTATGYDDMGLARYSMPQVPNINSSSVPFGTVLNPDIAQVARYRVTDHDAAGRPTRVADKSFDQTVRSSTYDYTGDKVRYTSPTDGVTTTALDAWDRPAKVTQYANTTSPFVAEQTANYSYSSTGNLTTISALVNSRPTTWSYRYDWAGRRLESIDPDTGTTTYGYDANSNVVSVDDAAATGAVTTQYDLLDRPVSRAVTQADGSSEQTNTWTYDDPSVANAKGRLTKTTSATPLGEFAVSVPGYDNRGNPSGVRYTYPGDLTGETPAGQSASKAYSYQYNDLGEVTQTTYPAAPEQQGLPQESFNRTYTTQGLPDVTDNASGDVVADATYNNANMTVGLLSHVSSMNSHDFNRLYHWDDATGELKTLQVTDNGPGGTTPYQFLQLAYSYDDSGNPLRVTGTKRTPDGVNTAAWCYTYDPLNRMTAAATGVPNSGDATCNTDGQSQAVVEGVTGASYDLRYTYDEDRLTSVTSIPDGQSATLNYARLMTIPQPHIPVSITGPASGSGANPGVPQGTVWSYDNAGRIEYSYQSGHQVDYTYDGLGRLSQTRTKTNDTPTADITSAYDADGFRVAQRTVDATTNTTSTTVYLGDTEITHTQTGATPSGTDHTTTRRHFTTDNGTPLGVQEKPASSSYEDWTMQLADAQNSIRFTQSNTQPQRRYFNYYPFGDLIGDSTPPGQRGYLNKPLDSTGEIRLDQRNYQPGFNVLTTPDALLQPQDPQSLNPYAYARNNPIAKSDPSGLMTADGGNPTLEQINEPHPYTDQPIDSGIDRSFNHDLGALAAGIGVGAAQTLEAGRPESLVFRLLGVPGPLEMGTTVLAQQAGADTEDGLFKGGEILGGLIVGVGAGGAAVTAAKVTTRAASVAKTGTSLVGRSYGLGTVVDNPGLAIRGFQGSKTPGHALNRIINRDVSPSMLRNTVANPKVVLRQGSGNYLHLSDDAAVVLRPDGQVVTAYGRTDFRQHVLDILADAG